MLKNKILTQNAQKKFHEYLSLSIIDYIKENSNLLQKLQNVKNTINNNTLFVQYLLVFLGLSLFIISFIFHKYKEIKKINYQDYLTGAFNRKKFFDITENLSQNYNTVVMMDIDHFKKINDTYGHSKGDLVLKEIVEIIKENIRKDDLIFRWGGEEFLILFKDVDAQTAFNIIQKIKNLIETHDFDGIKVTASFGIKECKEKISEKDLILVDKALYKAKEKRNDIVLVN
ncbi:GGDEF domain-containing protein [Caminibacter sp.]